MNYMRWMAPVLLLAALVAGCGEAQTESASGVKKLDTKVPVGSDGKTIEQRLVERRLQEDNRPNAIKFAYCGSAMTGDIIYQSVVEGKVVSSGKRLSPSEVAYADGAYDGFPVNLGGVKFYTKEVLEDDGTYGQSIPYLFWWDVDRTYFQQYITGGTFFVVTSRPVDFKRQTLKFEEYVRAHPEVNNVTSTPQ